MASSCSFCKGRNAKRARYDETEEVVDKCGVYDHDHELEKMVRGMTLTALDKYIPDDDVAKKLIFANLLHDWKPCEDARQHEREETNDEKEEKEESYGEAQVLVMPVDNEQRRAIYQVFEFLTRVFTHVAVLPPKDGLEVTVIIAQPGGSVRFVVIWGGKCFGFTTNLVLRAPVTPLFTKERAPVWIWNLVDEMHNKYVKNTK